MFISFFLYLNYLNENIYSPFIKNLMLIWKFDFLNIKEKKLIIFLLKHIFCLQLYIIC